MKRIKIKMYLRMVWQDWQCKIHGHLWEAHHAYTGAWRSTASVGILHTMRRDGGEVKCPRCMHGYLYRWFAGVYRTVLVCDWCMCQEVERGTHA